MGSPRMQEGSGIRRGEQGPASLRLARARWGAGAQLRE